MNGEPYTPEQIAFLKQYGADMSTKDLCAALNSEFGTAHSPGSVRTTAKKHGVRKTHEFRTKNARARGAEIGASCIVNGYEYIRTSKGAGGFYKDWTRKCRLVWTAAHGDIPDGHMVVFLNGNTLDCRPENLACISKQTAARMVNGHGKRFWSEFPEVTQTALRACELDEILSNLRKGQK